MTGYPASASSEPARPIGAGLNILVCGVNWVGDTVMTMPAVQAYRRHHPDHRLTVLVKPVLRSLWATHEAPDAVLELGMGWGGMRRTVREVRDGRFDRAFVLPNSWRSALVPFLAGVPERVGAQGHGRGMLLTQVVAPPQRGHQAREYTHIMVPEDAHAGPADAPKLVLPDSALVWAETVVPSDRPLVAVVPGAARGPSKQWPPAHYIELGRRLETNQGAGIIVLGSTSEVALCDEVAAGIGPHAVSFAGKTSFTEWMALLKWSDLVLCNDSGGMHLADALGTPLVAIFGMTDPERTGPLGANSRVIQNSLRRSRDVPRDSVEARKSLASIDPDRVYETALELLES